MNCKKNHKKGFKSICLVVLSVITMMTILSFATSVFADDDETKDMSLYSASSNAVSAFSEALGGNEDGNYDKGKIKDLVQRSSNSGPKTGNQCTFLGYSKNSSGDNSSGIKNFLTSNRTSSSSTYSYKQLREWANMNLDTFFDTSDDNDSMCAGFSSYAEYGRSLKALGLDATASTAGNMVRLLFGALYILAFYLASSIPMLFSIILKLLKVLNPFNLFAGAISSLSNGTSSLSELGKALSHYYTLLQDLSLYVIIPLLLAVTVGGALLFHSRGGGSNIGNSIGKTVVRLAFIVIAVPLFGGLYTGLLNGIGDMSAMGNSSINQIVYSEYVDFEGWASNKRLAIPSEYAIKWVAKDSDAVATNGGTQRLSIKINEMAGHSGAKPKDKDYANISFDEFDNMSAGSANTTLTDFKDAQNLIIRWMRGNVYSASSWEGEVKSAATKNFSDGDSSKNSKVIKEFTDGTTSGSFADYAVSNPNSIYGNGGLARSGGKYFTSGVDTSGKRIDAYSGKGGLSSVGMYNYLSTKFDESEMTVYSAENTSSEYVKDSHYSVNAVGSTLQGILWWLQSFITLLCMGIIGIIYALGLVLSSVKQGFKMMASLPGAMLGSLAFIGKFIVAFFVMIAEVLGTILLYNVFTEILSTVTTALSEVVNTTGWYGKAGSIANFIVALFTIMLILTITIFAIKNRRIFAKSIDEVMSNTMNRLGAGLRKPRMSMAGGLARSAAAGVGAGVGQKVSDAVGDKVGEKFGGNGALDTGAKGLPGSESTDDTADDGGMGVTNAVNNDMSEGSDIDVDEKSNQAIDQLDNFDNSGDYNGVDGESRNVETTSSTDDGTTVVPGAKSDTSGVKEKGPSVNGGNSNTGVNGNKGSKSLADKLSTGSAEDVSKLAGAKGVTPENISDSITKGGAKNEDLISAKFKDAGINDAQGFKKAASRLNDNNGKGASYSVANVAAKKFGMPTSATKSGTFKGNPSNAIKNLNALQMTNTKLQSATGVEKTKLLRAKDNLTKGLASSGLNVTSQMSGAQVGSLKQQFSSDFLNFKRGK